MAWLPRGQGVATDLEGTVVRPPGTALTNAFVATAAVDVRGFDQVAWAVVVMALGDQGGITRVDAVIQWTSSADPTLGWTDLEVDGTPVAGVTAIDDYVPQKAIPAGSSAPLTIGYRAPAEGRFMRLLLKSGAGNATNSDLRVDAYRRTR